MINDIQQKIDLKTKPIGSLGKLEEVALKIAVIQNTLTPEIKNPVMLVLAGDHGITDEGVSPFPKEVTFQMVMNFLNGGAAINVFCRQHRIDLKVVDAGVDFEFPAEANLIHAKIERGTKNILIEPAMNSETCQRAVKMGRAIIQKEYQSGCNTIGFGEMGIGNTSIASLLMHKLTEVPIDMCIGRGTGHDDAGLKKKKEILFVAAKKYNLSDPMDILATYGGLEIAMMVGSILEAKELGMIILVDGFISSAAVLVASKLNKSILNNIIFCHISAEPGHKLMLEHLNATPLVDLGMRLGEGSGVAVVYPIIESSLAFLNDMASFKDAGVTNKE